MITPNCFPQTLVKHHIISYIPSDFAYAIFFAWIVSPFFSPLDGFYPFNQVQHRCMSRKLSLKPQIIWLPFFFYIISSVLLRSVLVWLFCTPNYGNLKGKDYVDFFVRSDSSSVHTLKCVYNWVYLCNNLIRICFPGGSVVQDLLANAGDPGDAGSIPESGRSPGVCVCAK